MAFPSLLQKTKPHFVTGALISNRSDHHAFVASFHALSKSQSKQQQQQQQMGDIKERNSWMSVPAFGEWDLKKDGEGGGFPDYSVDFSKIREMRKEHKRDPSRVSIGAEEELLRREDPPPPHHHHHHDPRPRPRRPLTMKETFKSYFNCCRGV